MQNRRLLVIVGLMGALLGCGQKGPLVLPDAQRQHKKIGVPKPLPAAPAPSAPAGPTPPAAPDATGGGGAGAAQR